MKPERIITVHDELMANLFGITNKNIVMNYDRPTKEAKSIFKNGYISLILSEDLSTLLDKYNAKYNTDYITRELTYMPEKVKKGFSLTAQEIMLYCILLNHYIANNCETTNISVKDIQFYRGKKSYNDKTFDSYVSALYRLSKRKVGFSLKRKVGKSKLVFSGCHNLLTIHKTKRTGKHDMVINYDLGKLGQVIKMSKRYSCILPIEAYKLNFNMINKYLMANYISKIIYINKRRKIKEFKIDMSTIMKRLYVFNKDGTNSGITYEEMFDKTLKDIEILEFDYARKEWDEHYFFDEYKNTNSSEDKYYKIETLILNKNNKSRGFVLFKQNLEWILKILQDHKEISDYYWSINGLEKETNLKKLNLKESCNLSLVLLFN